MLVPLENPAENPCFGCGPEHAWGLRLQFARGQDAIGAFVECTHTPRGDAIGWPGLFHTGLHYTTLFETSYWAALELTGRVHTAHGPQTFDQQRLPRVGGPFTVRARLTHEDPVTVVAESHTPAGKPLARLVTTWRAASRAQVERAGLVLPDYLIAEMAP